MVPPDDPQPLKPIHAGWFLGAPWIAAVLVLIAFASGLVRSFSQLMPFGLGRYAHQNFAALACVRLGLWRFDRRMKEIG
ncbi:MAG: hypothetical protein ABMA13_22440 [Chthoniobacteraceae bacterium]